MWIKKIQWISEDALEADVVITDGVYELICFSQPCTYKEEDVIKEVIYAYNPHFIHLSDKREEYIEMYSIGGYKLTVRVIDAKKQLVSIGDILIEIDCIPGDIVNGDIIEFSCSRLDLY